MTMIPMFGKMSLPSYTKATPSSDTKRTGQLRKIKPIDKDFPQGKSVTKTTLMMRRNVESLALAYGRKGPRATCHKDPRGSTIGKVRKSAPRYLRGSRIGHA
ncbi:MAG: hypothetical protein OXF02_00215 [Simkaniaceae bacterium]|nr:hypothetical protein [Simkaniaceae bacterium]